MSGGRPWGLIAAAVAVVVLAVAVIGYAVTRDSSNEDTERVDQARTISGVTFEEHKSGEHETGTIDYAERPPFGGAHDPKWADCTGTVYDQPIRDENAVHSLEHGAVWITYRPDLPADEVAALRERVDGVGYMLMSPYPDLKDKISLQAWDFQLFVSSAGDERIDEFINDLRANPESAPEPGAPCRNQEFRDNPRGPSDG